MGNPAHLVHVDGAGLRIHLIGGDLIELAGVVELHAVGEVPSVGEREAHHLVPGLHEGRHHGHVGLCAGVGLNIGVIGSEELLGPLDGEVLRHIDEFAAAVVATAGIALCILVGQHRALRLKHRTRHEVFAGDHLKGAALAASSSAIAWAISGSTSAKGAVLMSALTGAPRLRSSCRAKSTRRSAAPKAL